MKLNLSAKSRIILSKEGFTVRLVIQRVKEASVKVDDDIVGAIENGLLVFIGIRKDDTAESMDYLIKKLLALRVFSDEGHHMNRGVVDVQGKILVVSQFTLYADCTKGNRPSFDKAMPPAEAEELYNLFVQKLEDAYSGGGCSGGGCSDMIATGIFGADMKVSLINDGPVTILLDSK